MSIPIAYLSHCTHTREAENFDTEIEYVFEPKSKKVEPNRVKYYPSGKILPLEAICREISLGGELM